MNGQTQTLSENTPVEETPKVETPVVEQPKVEEEVVNDRSAYNCPTCKGEGLVKDSRNVDVLCGNCAGTGKV